MKPGSQLLSAIGVIVGVGLLAWSANTQKPEVAAAVLQAVLSGAAIFASVALSGRQHRIDRRARGMRQARELAWAVSRAKMFSRSAQNGEVISSVGEKFFEAQVRKLCERIDSLQIDELPHEAYQAAIDLSLAAEGLVMLYQVSVSARDELSKTAAGTLAEISLRMKRIELAINREDFWEDY